MKSIIDNDTSYLENLRQTFANLESEKSNVLMLKHKLEKTKLLEEECKNLLEKNILLESKLSNIEKSKLNHKNFEEYEEHKTAVRRNTVPGTMIAPF